MLIVHLSPLPNTMLDFVLSTDGRQATGQGQASASQLPAHSGEVVGVVPWHVLSWHRVKLPPGVGSRLSTVLQSLLEDELLQEPSEVHLVASPTSGAVLRQGGEVLVAACAKSWLRQALAPLHAAGVRVQRLVPELQPRAEAQLQWLNHHGQLQALLCQADSVWPLPPQTAAAMAVAPHHPTRVWAEPALLEQAARHGNAQPQAQSLAQRLLRAAQSDWDLAQGEWGQQRHLRGLRWLQQAHQQLWYGPAWQTARRGALALLLVQLVGLNAWAWREQSALQAQQTALNQTLKDSFPQVKVVVDAPLQMQRELQLLQQASGMSQSADLDSLLQVLSAHWSGNAWPTQLHYRAGELRLGDLPPATLQQLSQVPWGEMGYSLRTDGQQAVLRVQGRP